MLNQNRSNPPIAVASGITKREHFAALFFAGMCANPKMETIFNYGDLATLSIVQADELIKQLATNEADSDPEDAALDDIRDEYYRPLYSKELVKRPPSDGLGDLGNRRYQLIHPTNTNHNDE